MTPKKGGEVGVGSYTGSSKHDAHAKNPSALSSGSAPVMGYLPGGKRDMGTCATPFHKKAKTDPDVSSVGKLKLVLTHPVRNPNSQLLISKNDDAEKEEKVLDSR